MSEKKNTKIEVLHASEAVRRRPEMYNWQADQEGLHYLLWDCIDELLEATDCDRVEIVIESSASLSILLNCVVFDITLLQPGQLEISMGLFGNSLSIFNAVSELVTISVTHQNKTHLFHFEFGALRRATIQDSKTGRDWTRVFIRFNIEIFRDCSFDCNRIQKGIATRNDLYPEINFVLVDP